MSTIYIAVGQCGNQIAASYFNTISKYKDRSSNPCVGLDGKLRCVFIDSEQKVVERIERLPAIKNQIRKENIVLGRKGRGSNWSYGYYGSSSEANMTQDALECIRKELEKCDCYCGAIITQSLAGGTGSGLGSRLTESLRDQMGLHWISNVTVAPHDRGESPLQHYNTLLALNTLTRLSDSILLLHNDWLLNQLSSPATPGTSPAVTQVAINDLIGQQLSNLFSPSQSLYNSKSGLLTNMEPWELIRSVCPFPSAKIMRCSSVKRQSKSVVPVDWSQLAGSLDSATRRAYQTLRGTLGAVCAVRGDHDSSFPARMRDVDRRVKKILRPVDWNPCSIDYWTDTKKEPESLSLAFNSGCIVDYLNTVVSKARVKFQAKAYVHWYVRHGAEESDFEDAFTQWENVISEYDYLTA